MTKPITLAELDEEIKDNQEKAASLNYTENARVTYAGITIGLMRWKADIIAREERTQKAIDELTRGGINDDFEGMIDAEELKSKLKLECKE